MSDPTITQILSNPVDDLAILLLGATIRLLVKTDKPSVMLLLYLLPLILRYIKRYFVSGHMRDKIEHLEYELCLFKQSFRQQKQRKIG